MLNEDAPTWQADALIGGWLCGSPSSGCITFVRLAAQLAALHANRRGEGCVAGTRDVRQPVSCRVKASHVCVLWSLSNDEREVTVLQIRAVHKVSCKIAKQDVIQAQKFFKFVFPNEDTATLHFAEFLQKLNFTVRFIQFLCFRAFPSFFNTGGTCSTRPASDNLSS